jgi:hypothetical protein
VVHKKIRAKTKKPPEGGFFLNLLIHLDLSFTKEDLEEDFRN